MTTKVNDAFTALASLIATTLTTSWTLLANPYELASNNELFLRQGYAVAYANGYNTNLFLSSGYTGRQVYRLHLTRRIDTTEHNSTAFTAIAQELYTAADAVITAVIANQTLSGASATANWLGTEPIEFLEIDDNARFLALTVEFEISFFET